MKRVYLFLVVLPLNIMSLFAQLSLDECLQKARANYPLIKQYGLVEQSSAFTIDNAAKANLPQITLSGKASYQSDVTKIPVSIPGYDIKSMSKDQYNILLEITQSLYDGGVVASQKRISKADAAVSKEMLNVSMYDINQRVQQLFFGTLLLDEQIKQNALLQEDLMLSKKSVEGLLRNGVAMQTDIDAIQVELLNAQQQAKSLLVQRRAYISMLGIFLSENLPEGVVLQKPTAAMPASLEVKRPELSLYEAQYALLGEKEKAIDTRIMPKIGLFAQGAYGRPGLNMLKNEFSPYYIVGAKIAWNISSLYTRKNDKRLLHLSRQQIESNRETFLFNTRLQTAGESEAIADLREKLHTDEAIITLRTNIRSKAENKVANGTLTVNEMLRQINAESEARQAKALHEIQLLKEIYQLKYIGNY